MANALALTKSEKQAFVTRTYGWMAFALLISAVSAFFTAQSHALLTMLFANGQIGFWILCIAEIILVLVLSAKIRTISLGAATAGFIAYSVIDGITLSSVFLVFQMDSIAAAFFGSALMFGIMSVYGITTKRDLTTFGTYLMMAVVGVIIASLVQFLLSLFTRASFTMFDILISIATAVIFTGLTAYDSQKVIRTAEYARDSDDYKKVSILAALELYLDFINIFLSLLRLFGKRRD
ncbi:MAG: Bax inhibitor-1/YccA family protein [Treponema sp.]|nr:Bax inhibitor-1/YccA family protein [Treponema sp.]